MSVVRWKPLNDLTRMQREMNFDEAINFAEKKMDEKHSTLSLDYSKEELNPYYDMFKKIFAKAREK